MTRNDRIFWGLLVATALAFTVEIAFVFLKVPAAQLPAGGLAQKIFYFHAPAAYAMYLSGGVGFLASAAYLVRASDVRDAWAKAGVECATCFGTLVMASGPLWAKKAWGVYWTFDPRLTSLLLTVLMYSAIVVLRNFGGSGEAERRFAAGFTILGTTMLPVIHYAVQLWGGNHPTVVTKGGGGLHHPDMLRALLFGFVAMSMLAVLLLWVRARVALAESRLAALEEQAAAAGLGDGA
ncbi:MAG TPA: cytochrome c biogenesis protein CcsA [Polyangiaceae bacterium]|nr:cytochrome c biogenesis protein CcsA [Polyangiaceae bacterium]